MKEYAMYRGEDLLCIGTIREIAEELNVKVETVRFYLTPTYQKRLAKRKNGNPDKQRSLVCLDYEE